MCCFASFITPSGHSPSGRQAPWPRASPDAPPAMASRPPCPCNFAPCACPSVHCGSAPPARLGIVYKRDPTARGCVWLPCAAWTRSLPFRYCAGRSPTANCPKRGTGSIEYGCLQNTKYYITLFLLKRKKKRKWASERERMKENTSVWMSKEKGLQKYAMFDPRRVRVPRALWRLFIYIIGLTSLSGFPKVSTHCFCKKITKQNKKHQKEFKWWKN